jgi:hypothetical protein
MEFSENGGNGGNGGLNGILKGTSKESQLASWNLTECELEAMAHVVR